MLEVSNLTKVYKTKNGADVRALDGVSLQFPETGMVFLLGKSGSGKSTLLNVCGGLDSPTDGEIIVKGRSSKKFSQSDFDSYRNTFIGFIFQEYNILNEFSVEDNIALALELQGKPKDKAAIHELLRQVDLDGYAKRKPNTLSGGQKQRIAIARALVKAPEIIMADEPTGALDSNTGKQVFETLKKLSQDKLVIVVSHDRDFAEQYGDRIIELRDGKVLSDVSKTSLAKQPLTGNVNAVGEVLCVKGGASLTDADMDKIKSFLKSNDSEIIIARDEQDVATFKKVNRISNDGSKEVFCDTDAGAVEKKQYSPEDSRFIRSKLPAKHSIKIGLSGLKSKPFRLTLTVLLCTVAFALFGLLSTMSFYDSEATFRETLQTGDISLVRVEKQYETHNKWFYNGELESEHDGYSQTRFGDADIEALQAQFGNEVFGSVSIDAAFSVRGGAAPYWNSRVEAIAYLPEGHSLRQQLNGKYPASNDEILLSTYTAEALVNSKAYDADGNALELNAPADIVGKKLLLANQTYTVVGLFDAGSIPEKYDSLKETQASDNRQTYEFEQELSDGLYLVAFVSEEQLQKLAKENRLYQEDLADYRSIAAALKANDIELPEWPNAQYIPYSDLDTDQTYTALVDGKTSPSDNEAILSTQFFYSLIIDWTNTLFGSDAEATIGTDRIHEMSTLAFELQSKGEWVDDNGKSKFKPFTAEQLATKQARLLTLLKQANFPGTLTFKLYNQNDQIAMGELQEFTIIGISELESDQYRVVLSDAKVQQLWEEQKQTVQYYSEVTSKYLPDKNAMYDILYLPYDRSEEQTNQFWELYQNEAFGEDGSRIQLASSFAGNLQMVDGMVKSLSQVFLYVGLVMAVFAILLFSNFISASISQKKREIGILRAVGARSLDVFKIFFSESFFITLICVVLSTVGCAILCGILNTQIAAEIGAALLVFGPMSIGVLVLIAFATAVISTFLPVYNAAKKKPVESIRAL